MFCSVQCSSFFCKILAQSLISAMGGGGLEFSNSRRWIGEEGDDRERMGLDPHNGSNRVVEKTTSQKK